MALRKAIILFKIPPEDRKLFPSMWKTLSVLKAFINFLDLVKAGNT